MNTDQGDMGAATELHQGGEDAQWLLRYQLREEIRRDLIALRSPLTENDGPFRRESARIPSGPWFNTSSAHWCADNSPKRTECKLCRCTTGQKGAGLLRGV